MAARGDRHAFEQLVESRLDRIFRTACAILGNEADASDATQDAFIAAWVQLPRLRDVAGVLARRVLSASGRPSGRGCTPVTSCDSTCWAAPSRRG